MGKSITILSSAEYYNNAIKALKEKDLVAFVSNINSTIILSGNDEDMLANATYLQVEGLFNLKQHKKALECISEGMRYNSGERILRLKTFEGVIYGYFGELVKAESLFMEVLAEIKEPLFATEVYLNLTWLYLTIAEDKNLEGAKKYLDKAKSCFTLLPNSLKRKLLRNYSVYYYYQQDYDKASEVLNDAFNYAEEKDLPELYNNLAEVLLKYSSEDSISSSIMDYLNKAEVIASKYNNKMEMAFSFYTRAMVELQEGQLFAALDTLYLAFDHFTEVEAYSYSLKCLLKINELVSEYKAECMRTMQEKLQNKVEGNPYYEHAIKK